MKKQRKHGVEWWLMFDKLTPEEKALLAEVISFALEGFSQGGCTRKQRAKLVAWFAELTK